MEIPMKTEQSIKIKTRLKYLKGFPDITAFAGVFCLMLMILLMSGSFVQVSGISVELPQISSAGRKSFQKMVITVDARDRIYFNDLNLKVEDLKKLLLEISSRMKTDSVIIRADAKSSFGTVASIMAVAEELNINAFLLTSPAGKDKAEVFQDSDSD